MSRVKSHLGPISAVWHAFFGADVDYFPRFIGRDGKARRIETDDLIRRIVAELASFGPPPNSEIDALLRRGRESLDEVKGLTEYEDQKATRNLTITTFLSALAGVLFSGDLQIYIRFGIPSSYLERGAGRAIL
jgi:hypothetical protein